MDAYAPLPFAVALDDTDDPADVIDALALGPFVAGTQPVARTARLERVRADAPLLPHGVPPSRSATGSDRRTVLAQGQGWTLRATRWHDACATVTVVAETEAIAEAVLADAVRDACEAPANDCATLPVAFWHRTSTGRARRASREIAAMRWEAVAANYSAPTRAALAQLSDIRSPEIGRLILLHGPPGTGKTSALRAVATEWRDWCVAEVVIDAERLYGDSAYLTAVLLGRDEETDETGMDKWRLLVLEDCDELLRADAKKEAGQALGRLLNMTDGFMAQGARLLVALTTNEPIASLHAAVTRPGRCLADIHIGRLSRAEAAAWLGPDHPPPRQEATLAELYSLRSTAPPVRARPLRSLPGTYL